MHPDVGPAVQVKFADTGKPVQRLAVISGAGGSLFDDALAMGADCLLTGEANHHHAIDAKRLGLSLIAAGPLRHRIPGDRRCGERSCVPPLPERGRAGEHRQPGPVYVFVIGEDCSFFPQPEMKIAAPPSVKRVIRQSPQACPIY